MAENKPKRWRNEVSEQVYYNKLNNFHKMILFLVYLRRKKERLFIDLSRSKRVCTASAIRIDWSVRCESFRKIFPQ